jgi:hypothetical protein
VALPFAPLIAKQYLALAAVKDLLQNIRVRVHRKATGLQEEIKMKDETWSYPWKPR